jgi:uncharacterized protein YodC (DUF2158 family)
MEIKFNPGVKVKLKSGGPDMTIRGVHFDVLTNEYSADMYDCIWFEKKNDGKQEVHYCPFYVHELVEIAND